MIFSEKRLALVFLELIIADALAAAAAAAVVAVGQEPVFISAPLDLKIVSGDQVTLPCHVANLGDHSLVWSHGQRVLTARTLIVVPDDRLRLAADFSLIVANVSRSDAGRFTCTVSSTPIVELTHTVTVLYPPTISVLGAEEMMGEVYMVNVREHSNLSLQCNVTGNPTPSIYWRKQNGNEPQMQNGAHLAVVKIDRQMSGQYVCVADNGIGPPKTASVNINVLYAPEIKRQPAPVFTDLGRNARIVCIVHAEPEAKVTWHRHQMAFDPERHFSVRDPQHRSHHVLIIQPVRASDLGRFTCRARNRLGQSTLALQLTGVPMRPEITSAEQSDSVSTYRLSWQVGSYSPVTEYRISYSAIENSTSSPAWKTLVIPVRDTSPSLPPPPPQQLGVKHIGLSRHHVLLTHLTASTSYQLHVQAANRHGPGAQSKTLEFHTLSHSTALSSARTVSLSSLTWPPALVIFISSMAMARAVSLP